MLKIKLAPLALVVGLVLAAQSAAAQQIGRQGYNFPARNPSLAAQFQFQERMAGDAASAAGGLGALNQFVTTYNTSSTSIGNMVTVTQTLSEGSTGYVDQLVDQESTGNQGSEATSDIVIDESIVSETSANEPPEDNLATSPAN